MQNDNNDSMPDPIDFIPGQKIDSNSNVSTNTQQQISLAPVKKKKSIVVTVLTIILLIPLVIVAYIVISLVSLSVSHGQELGRLEDDTVSTFRTSGFAPSTYDCHDVELRNTCYFTLATSDSKVDSFLVNQGFSKDRTFGKGYIKDELYIENYNGSYSSYYYSK